MPDFGSSTFSQTDANNNTGTMPSWSGAAAPSTLDDAGRALQGAVTREWNWRSYTLTATGTADTKVLTYSVAPAAYYNGQRFAFIANTTNTTTVTLNVNLLGAVEVKKDVSGTLTSLAAGDMVAGMFVEVAYNTANSCFVWVNQKASTAASTSTAGVVQLATAAEVLAGTSTTKAPTTDAASSVWKQGADVASAATVTLGDGGYFVITGTTTITALAFTTDKAGRMVDLKFSGALTLTHNATSLILPGGASITTAAGDVARFRSEGSGNFRCVGYMKANGQAVVVPTSGGYSAALSTLTTTSGSTQTASGLTLTSYKKLYITVSGVSYATSAASTTFAIAGVTFGTLGPTTTDTLTGTIEIDLFTGYGTVVIRTNSGAYSQSNITTTISNSTTSIAFTVSNANSPTFDAGTITVYGVA